MLAPRESDAYLCIDISFEFHSLIIPNFMRVKKKKKEIENDNML